MAAWYKLVLCLSIAAIVSLGTSTDPRVTTGVGEIIGVKGVVEFDGRKWTVDRYLGIPYAEAPVGERRFQKPIPEAHFDTPFEAKTFGPSCIQMEFPGLPSVGAISEDCLFLNVYVPAEVSEKPASGLPVMFFVHGGAFVVGSGNVYVSETLSAFGEVIVVTINYRLGMLGLLNTGFEGALGNFGLWDQHLALQWVHNNIAAFGGDNRRVTIFGESAGSTSVALQSLFPGNKGLFQRAIGQSGAITPGIYNPNDISLSRFMSKEFGCDLPEDSTPKEILFCLRKASTDDILTKMTELASDPVKAMQLSFFPTIDNDFIKVPFSSLFELKQSEHLSQEESMFASIDFLIGVNSKEGAAFAGKGAGEGGLDGFVVDREAMDTMYVPLALYLAYPSVDTSALKDLVSAQYTDWSRPDHPEALRDMFVDMTGDVMFVEPSISLARKHANLTNAGKTYFYRFCTEPSTHILSTGKWLKGASHGDELAYVFGFPQEMLEKISPNKFIAEGWEIQHSKIIMTLWTNFAKTGNPNEPMDVRPYLQTRWPEFDNPDEGYLEIDRMMSAESVKTRLRAKAVNFWSRIIPRLVRAIALRVEEAAEKYTSDIKGTCSSPDSCSP